MAIANAADREAQEEQLDWLHELHEQARRQTGLLEQQTRYLRMLYRAAIVWLVLVVAGSFTWLMLAAAAPTPY